jgi:integrase/recombinase XerD
MFILIRRRESICTAKETSGDLPVVGGNRNAAPELLAARVPTAGPDRPFFVRVNDIALTRFEIYKIIRRYTKHVVKQRSDGRLKAVSPHVWRHSTAVHLLECGVEVNVIRAWLGHASLETTNRYAEITIRTKQAALEKCTLSGGAEKRIPRKPVWQTDAALLDWLRSL